MLKELESLDLELRRLLNWIQGDALHYWSDQQQTVRRRLAESLDQLSRCMSYVRPDERRPCTEEKKRVAHQKERALLCEEKLRIVDAANKHWQTRCTKVKTRLRRCNDMAESDVMVALNKLQLILDKLAEYQRLQSDHGSIQSLLASSILPAMSSGEQASGDSGMPQTIQKMPPAGQTSTEESP
jgi:hypothetical protein